MNATAVRHSDMPIDPDILTRWSPRAFDGSVLDETTLLTLFEAARWAPSAYNYQPWRFTWSLRGDEAWHDYLSVLLPFNAAWAASASALIFILADRFITAPGKDEPAPSATASFDTGSAWGLLALQAAKSGLHTHALAGFDHDRATALLGGAERFRVETAVAVGRIGDAGQLPEILRAREFPSSRRPLSELAFRARLPG